MNHTNVAPLPFTGADVDGSSLLLPRDLPRHAAEPPVDADLRQLHRDAMNLTLFRPVNVDEQLLAALKEADDIEKDAEDEVVPLSTQLEEKPRAKRDVRLVLMCSG